MPHLFISTAEVSGDLHAARLFAELKARSARQYTADALGGEQLRRAGARILEDHTTKSSVGLVEGLPFLFSSMGLLGRMRRRFRKSPYDLVLLVDGQGRNLPLGHAAKRAGLKTAYYFPPPVSIWGAWNIARMREHDLLLCPFEADHRLYREGGCKSLYTGHPFSSLPQRWSVPQTRRRLGLAEDGLLLALFPGSRVQEISTLTRCFLTAAGQLARRHPGLRLVLSLAHPDYRDAIQREIRKSGLAVPIIEGDGDGVLQSSDLLLTASGTATLQAAFYRVPMAIAYRVSPLTEFVARRLVKVEHIGLPNILAGKTVCQEFIGRDLTPERLAAYLGPLVDNAPARAAVAAELGALRAKLSTEDPYGAMVRAIEALVPDGETA